MGDTNTTTTTTTRSPMPVAEVMNAATDTTKGGLSGGAIAGIVIAVIVAVILVAIGTYFLVKFLKDRRRNHGEYRPQFEETHHAKDLPYLQPPAVEGLI